LRTGGEASAKTWKEIALAFVLLGTTFGGPAIMGIMQAEIQEKRQWVTKARLVEGLSLVTALPVVVGVFLVAIYRLGKAVAITIPQRILAIASALALALTPLGVVSLLALGGAVGLVLFYSRRVGAIVLCGVCALLVVAHFSPWSVATLSDSSFGAADPSGTASLLDIGSFFLMTGAFSFGGGLSLIAFIQQQVVNHHHWLTAEEFVAGLAIGQLTPGPIIMVAAYVGYKLAGVAGAAVATASVFLPSFVLMLSILPFFERATKLLWTKAAMKGIGPVVLGVLAVSLVQVASHALPDFPAIVLFVVTVVAMLAWRVGIFRLMAGGAVLGALYTASIG
jgi:chromate transporter